jgi:hypothetical protein
MRAANKIRDKRECCKEMILELDPACVAERGGASIISAVQEMGTSIAIEKQPLPMSMRWRRKVSREWDEEKESWKPCAERQEYEPFVLVRLDALEFSNLVLVPNGEKHYYTQVCQKYPNYSVIFFIEGTKDMLKSRTRAIDSQIRNGVRAMFGQQGAGRSGGAGAANGQRGKIATKAELDAAMLWMQMQGNTFIQLSESLEESQRYIVSFTSSIATIPERK